MHFRRSDGQQKKKKSVAIFRTFGGNFFLFPRPGLEHTSVAQTRTEWGGLKDRLGNSTWHSFRNYGSRSICAGLSLLHWHAQATFYLSSISGVHTVLMSRSRPWHFWANPNKASSSTHFLLNTKWRARLLSWNVLHRNKAKETLAAAEWARCVQILKRFTARVDSRFQTNDIVPPKALLVPLSEALVQCVTDWSHNLLGSTTNTCSWKEHPLTLNLPLKNINKKSQNFKPSSCFIHIPGPPSFR